MMASAALITRVATLEQRMNEQDQFNVRLERKVDGITADLTELKSGVNVLRMDVGWLKESAAALKANVGLLANDVNELKAGQVGTNQMLATLLARTEGMGEQK